METDDQITKNILNILINKIDKNILSILPAIQSQIKKLVQNALRSEPEYASLKSGTLKAEFGIPNSESIDMVVDALTNSLFVETKRLKISGNIIVGGFILKMIQSDNISDIIYTDIASVIDTSKGYRLPWLEWLLLRGTDDIVINYDVKYGPSSFSRTNLAIMVPANTNWSVPKSFAGTTQNNWTTRAIAKIEKGIYAIIKKNIEDKL